MAAAPTGPADRHASDAARFTELVESAGPGDGSGQFGTAVPVAPDASPQDRLMAFIGRNPAWTEA
jgi:hypothetical protein